MDNPAFSLVIPTYQRRAMVCESVRSLCEINYKGQVEIIVVVDGSTDGTAEALKELSCPFPLRVIEQENRGAGAARNHGATEAKGDIFLFLDDDMSCEPDVLTEHAQSYRAGADAVVGDFIEPQSSIGFLSQVLERRKASGGDGAALTPFDIFGGHISIRRDIFQELGGFDDGFGGNGDYGDFDVGQRLLRRFTVHHNPAALSYHRGVLGAREFIGRARNSANATARFAAKHPELRNDLIEWTGASRISNRLRLVSRIPVLPGLVAGVIGVATEIGARTPLRSSRALKYLRNAAYTLAYWSTMQRNSGFLSP
jgi:glycosyltransferase involved in cell wall biosynthesis